MKAEQWSEIENEIVADLQPELEKDADFSPEILASKVRSAIREVISLRHYENTPYTDEMIIKDLWNYYSVIKNLSLFDYNIMGAEFETEHSENDIKRTWGDKRNNILSNVYGFIKVL